jgi:hypothetical protein
MNKKIVCLTPIKNEEWILDKFLSATSIWADEIIVAFQTSSDSSLKICKKYSKVKIIYNNCKKFNEPERQKLLINEARKQTANMVLIALDADEFLSLNKESLMELNVIRNLPERTVVNFDWVNIKLKQKVFWYAPQKMSFGFVDDGSSHHGQKIHSPRIPIPKNAKEYNTKYIKVMHYQYADWERMESKQRWYQCWEMINSRKRNPVNIYRQYHHMYSIKDKDMKKIPTKWFNEYEKYGIDLKHIESKKPYYWDAEVIEYIKIYGAERFKNISIWDYNWNLQLNPLEYNVKDPRNIFDKMIQQYLKISQNHINNIFITFVDSLAKVYYKICN